MLLIEYRRAGGIVITKNELFGNTGLRIHNDRAAKIRRHVLRSVQGMVRITNMQQSAVSST